MANVFYFVHLLYVLYPIFLAIIDSRKYFALNYKTWSINLNKKNINIYKVRLLIILQNRYLYISYFFMIHLLNVITIKECHQVTYFII